MTELMRAEGIKKSFFKGKTEVPVIRGVDLVIGTGEMVAITGASGVGKSTLLHILGTLEPPTAGHVLLARDGKTYLSTLKRRLRCFAIGHWGSYFSFITSCPSSARSKT